MVRLPIEVGVIILHTPNEFKERMVGLLNNCASKTLHALINTLPEDVNNRLSMTKNAMRQSCRYAERWVKPAQPPGVGGYVSLYMRGNQDTPAPGFETTMGAIIDNIPFHSLLGILGDNNELRQDTMKIVASKFR